MTKVRIVFWDVEGNYGGTRIMEPMYLSIRTKETGQKIKKLLLENGYTVRDIQDACGFENPQAIYKWISGKSLPSLDNFVILSKILHTSIEDIRQNVKFKKWFFGHYHDNRNVNAEEILLWEQIIRIA